MIVVPRRKLRNVDSRVVSRYGIYRGLHLRGSGLLLGDFPNFWMIKDTISLSILYLIVISLAAWQLGSLID